jgi:TonB family protein
MQNTDKTLAIALIISFASHSFMFVPAANLSLFDQSKKPAAIEVTYIAPIQDSTKKTADTYTKADDIKAVTIKQASLPAEKISLTKDQNTIKDETAKIAAIEEAKTKADIDIKKSTANLDYQQLLKAKVRNYSFPSTSMSQGKVNLSFTLSNDGQLRMIKIIEETSSNDHKLRLAAIECIKQANPFPPFPDNLKMQEATFNVTISFMSE